LSVASTDDDDLTAASEVEAEPLHGISTPERRYQYIQTPETSPRHHFGAGQPAPEFLQIRHRDNSKSILLLEPLATNLSTTVKDLKDKMMSEMVRATDSDTEPQLQIQGTDIILGNKREVQGLDRATGGGLILEFYEQEKCPDCNSLPCAHAFSKSGCTCNGCKRCHLEFNSRNGRYECGKVPLPKESRRRWNSGRSRASSIAAGGTYGNYAKAPNNAASSSHGNYVQAWNGAAGSTNDGFVQVPAVGNYWNYYCTPCFSLVAPPPS